MKKLCKCGHDHIELLGDLGELENECGYDIIVECTKCDCENYEVKK